MTAEILQNIIDSPASTEKQKYRARVALQEMNSSAQPTIDWTNIARIDAQLAAILDYSGPRYARPQIEDYPPDIQQLYLDFGVPLLGGSPDDDYSSILARMMELFRNSKNQGVKEKASRVIRTIATFCDAPQDVKQSAAQFLLGLKEREHSNA